jgi:hypothetical protein
MIYRTIAQYQSEYNNLGEIPQQGGMIISDDLCQLGKWIYFNDSYDHSYSSLSEKLQKVHRDFHLKAGNILTLIYAGDIEVAKSLVNEFYQLSNEVTHILEKIRDSK